MIKFSLKRFQWYRILFPTLTSPAALCRGNDTQHFGVCPQPPSRGLVFLWLIDIWVVFQFSLVPTSLRSSIDSIWHYWKAVLRGARTWFSAKLHGKNPVIRCVLTLFRYSHFDTESFQTYSWNKCLKIINLRDDIDLDISVPCVCVCVWWRQGTCSPTMMAFCVAISKPLHSSVPAP